LNIVADFFIISQMDKGLILKVGKNHTIAEIAAQLISFGYEKTSPILSSGQFHYLGGDVIIFPTNSIMPIRLEFFGDDLESINYFNLETSKKGKSVGVVNIEDNLLRIEGSKTKPGDYIVHIDHGIGLFSHRETKKINDEEISYIVVNYLNQDVLRVPVGQIDKLSRYIGIGRRKPRLNKLGTATWERTYRKTYNDVIKLARELLEVYASRKIANKKPLHFNQKWESEIVKTFGFVETSDQIKTLEEVYLDLQKNVPMDRLICGDVGFGKTEVAIRTITQAAANGCQSVVLAPTTILCEQHYRLFEKRFADLPIKIARLSRFTKKDEAEKILAETATGNVDVLISTHKILRNNPSFENLGLLVIDEEQKFGVKDKEKLKKLKENIDVLTLTATPIPRTLFMSLSGLRDISRLYSPPVNRLAINTRVEKYDDFIISDAIAKETGRGGQVYYLHNEVATTGGAKQKLEKMLPGLKIEVAHGQMGESALMGTMSKFTAGEIDVLVCSTIIENGLDLPNVNTLIVDESDKFGLSQLYQIRGRIGRSSKQAYAIFTYRDKKLTQNALKRLRALAENTELGTGYEIALSDLEIRGGGNILGRDQHGNMEAVGLVLYSKLLEAAVTKFKSQ